MNNLIKTTFLLSLCISTYAFADVASVKINSPMEGAKLKNNVVVDYDVVRGPNGDHVHMYADGKEMSVIKVLKGKYTFENLKAGGRDLCIKIVDKGHTPIGVEKCVHVTVE